MISRLVLALFLFFLPSLSLAGDIWGKIEVDGVSSSASKLPVEIKIKCETKEYSAAEKRIPTSYRINVEETGECHFEITVDSQTLSFTIQSKDNAMRYNFKVKKKVDGSYSLNRR